MIDYLLHQGTVIEGSGLPPQETNIGIEGDKITYIGREDLAAKRVINAKGLIVAPGFIDTHAHSEFTLLADGRAEGKIAQGVATEVNGNCGLSAAPLKGDALAQREADLEELGIAERWPDLAHYFTLLESKGVGINFATLCGHGNVRASVIGYENRVPSSQEYDGMKALVREALSQGARGMSTGLIYPPGVYSTTEELIELSKVVAQGRGIYTSHMRSEGDALLESIEEIVAIAKSASVRVHISHIKTSGAGNWHKIDHAIQMIEEARQSGLQLTCDRYPYIAAGTDLDTLLPAWVYEGGIEKELQRLGTESLHPQIKAEVIQNASKRGGKFWKGIYVSSVTKDENKWMEGEDFATIAARVGRRPEDALIDILIDERARVGALFFSMCEENLKRFLKLPYLMIGSDSSTRSFSGPTRQGKPHPRGFGSFPRFIGKYVRDEQLMELPDAIRKITSLPASTFQLHKRGLLREGFYADITVFNYEKIIDRATFRDPFTSPEGINYVFVNGKLALEEGSLAHGLYGKVIV